ncbi:hypothetical protein P12x_005538 [Tundrisphaera lichenicola]|uniref:hypothetical protein n=1 Tax=Tundrisphaera lichenicola TaxID=2029860 RepID=UPI003EBCF644
MIQPWRALSLLLLISAALPPPEMAGLLIQDAARHEPAPAKNTTHARGRHRVVSSFRADSCQVSARFSLGERAKARPSRLLPRWLDSIARVTSPTPCSPAAWTRLHLRC